MSITWKEPAKAEIDCELFVTRKAPYEGHSRNSAATPDDLRAACAAVGLVVCTGDEKAEAIDEREANLQRVYALTEEQRARAEKAETLAKQLGESYERCVADLRTMHEHAERSDASLGAAEDEVETLKLGAENAASRLKHAKEVCDDLRTKLAAAEAELKDVKGHHDGWMMQCGTNERTIERLTAEREEARAKLAALTAPVEGEPSYAATCDAWDDFQPGTTVGFGMHQWRAGYAACAARHQPTEPRATDAARRATDEELIECYLRAERAEAFGRAHVAGVMAVRDMLRAERPACLVERAVKSNVDIEVAEASLEYPGHRYIRVLPPKRELSANRNVPDAEAAATLAAMLTEVGA